MPKNSKKNSETIAALFLKLLCFTNWYEIDAKKFNECQKKIQLTEKKSIKCRKCEKILYSSKKIKHECFVIQACSNPSDKIQ
jgi:hypothetical protein